MLVHQTAVLIHCFIYYQVVTVGFTSSFQGGISANQWVSAFQEPQQKKNTHCLLDLKYMQLLFAMRPEYQASKPEAIYTALTVSLLN